MDDFDDLLNNFEKDYGGKKAQAGKAQSSPSRTATNGQTSTSGAGSATTGPRPTNSTAAKTSYGGTSLNSMIDDILSDDIAKANSQSYSSGSAMPDFHRDAPRSVGSSSSRSCYQVVLGGSQYDLGVSTNTDQRPCAKLRCIDCDFVIECFDDSAWKADTDYLFLRNNMPNRQKLSQQLVRKPQSRAYCCQCKFASVIDLTPVQRVTTKVRWACAKHS